MGYYGYILPHPTLLVVTNSFCWSILITYDDQVTDIAMYVMIYYKLRKDEMMMNREYVRKMTADAVKVYTANGGKIVKCRDGSAKGTGYHRTIMARSKKCMTYDITSPPKMRLMNYEPVFNIPNPYNGCKMVMGNY